MLPAEVWQHIRGFVPRDRDHSSPTAAAFCEGVRREGWRGSDGRQFIRLLAPCPVCFVHWLPSRYFFEEGRLVRDPCCGPCLLMLLSQRLRSDVERTRQPQEQSRWVPAHLPRLYPWRGAT